MIRLANSEDISAIRDFLSLSDVKSSLFHESLLETYGTNQIFFKIYIQVSETIDAVISLLDSSAFLTVSKSSDVSELNSFLQFNPLISVVTADESDFDILKASDGFDILKSDLLMLKNDVVLPEIQQNINVSPSIDNIYNIMKEYFTLKSRDEFKSDMLHRINHGRAFSAAVYSENAIISCASVLFCGNRAALIGGVCTDIAYRGRGLASQTVTYLCCELRNMNKIPLITCKSESGRRLYVSLGFTEAGKRITMIKKQ